MAVVLNNGDVNDYSIGILLMEGGSARLADPLKSAYKTFDSFVTPRTSASFAETWNSKQEDRAKAYGGHAAAYDGSLTHGHTAILVRQAGTVTMVSGFVPGDDPDDATGKWRDDRPMLADPRSVSYEVAVGDVLCDQMEEKLGELMRYGTSWDWNVPVRKQDKVYNCLSGALRTIEKLLRKNGGQAYLQQFQAFDASCEWEQYSQAWAKRMVMTGERRGGH